MLYEMQVSYDGEEWEAVARFAQLWRASDYESIVSEEDETLYRIIATETHSFKERFTCEGSSHLRCTENNGLPATLVTEILWEAGKEMPGHLLPEGWDNLWTCTPCGERKKREHRR